ncbi:hypothetical protein FACS1894153_0650 [Bacteroidia bacterium]|nr:hypothetical protein FACS1894153_0650 [Bacteroidia bacterium]
MKNILIILFLFTNVFLYSQNISIDSNSVLDEYMKKSVEFNKYNASIEGYSINIFSETGSSARRNIYHVKEVFDSAYPEHKSFISFDDLYFNLNVCVFTNKSSATKFLAEIRKLYPNAYIVKAKFKPEDMFEKKQKVVEKSENSTE